MLALLCVSGSLLRGVSGQSVGDLDYSQATCTAVVGNVAFPSTDDNFLINETGANNATFTPTAGNIVYLTPFTPAAGQGGETTTLQVVLDDNSGLYFPASGTVAIRLAIYEQTVGGSFDYGSGYSNPTFQLLMESEEIVLSNPTAGVYNATLVYANGSFGTFDVSTSGNNIYFLAEWFNTTINIDYDLLQDASFVTNDTGYEYTSAGYPATVVANLYGPDETYYNSPNGDHYEYGPIALSNCVAPSVAPTNPSQVVGDPQFSGLLGQSYQVHGIDGAHYNLITSDTTQVNARFVYLQSGVCPPVSATNCWSHPGSYLGAVGVMELVDGVAQQLAVQAGSAAQGFFNVTLNGELLSVGSSATIGSLSVTYVSAYRVTVDTAQFSFVFDNSDWFVNQQVSSRVPVARLTSHGLLGQTHHMRRYNTVVKYIEGSVDDYSVSEDSLWGTTFPYNQFQQPASSN